MAKEVQLAVRMTTEDRAALKKAAETMGHTLSGYILWLMRETLRREGFYVTAAAKRATTRKK